MTTVEERGLLDAVCRNPADDTPRLVYADWLQENGFEPRAEFIRVQCHLSTIQFDLSGWSLHGGETIADLHRRMKCECHSCKEAAPLWEREEQLLASMSDWWASPDVPCLKCEGAGTVGGYVGDNITTPVDFEEHECPDCSGTGRATPCHRGFLHTLTVPAEWFLANGSELIWNKNQNRPCPPTAHPIRKVTLTSRLPPTKVEIKTRENEQYRMTEYVGRTTFMGMVFSVVKDVPHRELMRNLGQVDSYARAEVADSLSSLMLLHRYFEGVSIRTHLPDWLEQMVNSGVPLPSSVVHEVAGLPPPAGENS